MPCWRTGQQHLLPGLNVFSCLPQYNAGAAKEVAVLAALRLLRAALDRDTELVAAIRAATHSGG